MRERFLIVAWLMAGLFLLSPSGCSDEPSRDAGVDEGPGDDAAVDADWGADGSDPMGDPHDDSPADPAGDPGSDPVADPTSDPGSDSPEDIVSDEGPIIGLPYPVRDTYRIKAIQPDFWPDMDELVNHNTGGVAMNMVWSNWEPSEKTPPCGASEEEYGGHCFRIDGGVDQAILDWTERGVVVTGIVYGVPEWARVGNTNCSPISDAFAMFCAPDHPEDYGRFAGMLAQRYDGLHGHGRIADFVIHNEVNSNDWFDIGCGQGTPCDMDAWIRAYSDNYTAAYDLIKTHQSEAKVLIPFTHYFDAAEFDRPADEHALISVQTFTIQFDGLVGDRQWQIAYHPYAPNLRSPVFSPLDLPRVTYGNLGIIVGWLRTTFPDKPHAWPVQLTESGIDSAPPDSSEPAQAAAVCDSLRNVLGTPGITNYIYHRLRDCSTEEGLMLGLIDSDDRYKPAWAVWALANHIDDVPPVLDCGFEHLPYTRLARSYKQLTLGRIHWISTRLPPDEFNEEAAWFLLRDEDPGTRLLFECLIDSVLRGPHTFLSFDPACEGQQIMGPVGYIWTAEFSGSVPLYRCRNSAGWDHFISTDPGCEGQVMEELLGYALP